MKHLFLSLLAALLLVAPLYAQVDCYSSTRAQGISLMQQGHFAQAIQVFESAKFCPDMPADNDLQAKINECRRKIQENDEARRQREAEERNAEELRRRENEIAAKGYMEIKDLTFTNIDRGGRLLTPLDAPFYDEDLRFLKVDMTYKGLVKEAKQIKLDIKLLMPDGTVNKGKSTDARYSFEPTVTVSPNGGKVEILSWGTYHGGSYSPGVYTCEIWYAGKRLFSKKFEVLRAKKPDRGSAVQVKDIVFANVTKDDKIINDFGTGLHSEDMRYLKSKINYVANETKNLEFFIRIFNPDGALRTGTGSPPCYTTKKSYTLSSATGWLAMVGWGNESSSVYPPGTYEYEVWLKGEKLIASKVVIQEEAWKVALKKVYKQPDDKKTIYLGEKNVSGKMEGWGTQLFSIGASAWGVYSNDKQNGRALYIASQTGTVNNCPECAFYVGDWNDGLKSGNGSCYSRDGKLLYYGNFVNDKPTQTYPMTGYESYRFEILEQEDGSYYIGETLDGKWSGMGILVWKSGAAWFGQWRNGIRNGQGFQIDANGNVSSGRWVGDIYSGK